MLTSAAVGVCALFTAATPHAVIFLVLLVSGCLRSLQFTSLQAISFAEVKRETMSQASSIASMAQRLAQSLGVAIGAYALQISGLLQGHADLVVADFPPAFVAIALLSAVSLFFHAALPPDAGAEISGHGRPGGAPLSAPVALPVRGAPGRRVRRSGRPPPVRAGPARLVAGPGRAGRKGLPAIRGGR